MSIRRPLRGAALEIAEAVKACRAAADRGDVELARELEHKLYLRTLNLIANGSKRSQRLAFTALSVAAVLGERFGPPAVRLRRPPPVSEAWVVDVGHFCVAERIGAPCVVCGEPCAQGPARFVGPR